MADIEMDLPLDVLAVVGVFSCLTAGERLRIAKLCRIVRVCIGEQVIS